MAKNSLALYISPYQVLTSMKFERKNLIYYKFQRKIEKILPVYLHFDLKEFPITETNYVEYSSSVLDELRDCIVSNIKSIEHTQQNNSIDPIRLNGPSCKFEIFVITCDRKTKGDLFLYENTAFKFTQGASFYLNIWVQNY